MTGIRHRSTICEAGGSTPTHLSAHAGCCLTMHCSNNLSRVEQSPVRRLYIKKIMRAASRCTCGNLSGASRRPHSRSSQVTSSAWAAASCISSSVEATCALGNEHTEALAFTATSLATATGSTPARHRLALLRLSGSAVREPPRKQRQFHKLEPGVVPAVAFARVLAHPRSQRERVEVGRSSPLVPCRLRSIAGKMNGSEFLGLGGLGKSPSESVTRLMISG